MMRSQAPTAFIAVIITLAACAIAFLAYLMWNSKNDSSSAAPATTTIVSTTVATETVTESPSTVTVTSPSDGETPTTDTTTDDTTTTSRENNGSYAAPGEPCTSDEANDRVKVGRRTLVCTYQGEDASNQYQWEYASSSDN